MSLPASLTTDCGGLLNRRGPGRKRCCHTGLFTRDIRFTLHTDCSCPELSNWYIFTRSIAESHGVLSRDLSFGPTDQREVICELSIFFFTRRIAEVTVLLSRIIELSNFFSHGESRDLCHELSNCRIFLHTESHGGFLCHETCSWSRICELVYFHTDGRGGYEGGTIEA